MAVITGQYKKSGRRLGTWAVFCCALMLFLVPARAATFTAALDRDTLTLGESATLSLTFAGTSAQDAPALPEIPNLQITYVGPSSQFSFINGQVSSTVTHNFMVTARKEGEFTIPALVADVGGQKLTTQPLKLKVLKPGAPPQEAINSGTELAFLKLVVPKKEVYVGESFSVQLQFYLNSRVQGIEQSQQTAFPADGFNVIKMTEERGQRRQVQIGNAVYTMIPMDVALKAIKAGSFTLGPVTYSMVLALPSANRQRDIFDPLGMMSRVEQKQVSLASEAQPIQSLTLPRENVPTNFNGAVGSYTLTLSAGPTNLAVGDPITVRVQISGRGSLDAITLPEQPAWAEFKSYPPTTKVETTDPLGLEGSKTFEQLLVPQNGDIKELPPLMFSYFDPELKAYRTLKHPAFPLVIRPNASASGPTVLASTRSTQENQPPAQDIVPNKQRLGSLAQIGPPLVQRSWFIGLQGVPVLALVSAFAWRKRSEQLANNPRLRRQRQVAQIIRDGMERLGQLATENKSDEFFGTLVHLLQERLGERLDVPANAVTESVIAERLRPKRVAEPLLGRLEELFQACNLARYAPVKSSQELAAFIPKLEKVLNELQEVKL